MPTSRTPRPGKPPRPSARSGTGLTLIDAPWRHQLFDGPPDPQCFICRAVLAPRRHDRENLLLVRGEHAVIVLNRFPYTMGALMIAPIQHLADFRDIPDAVMLEIAHLLQDGMAVLDEAIHPKGYNLGVNQGEEAGAGLRHHLHVHLVPRWGADTNFMTTTGGARVLAEDVDSMYARLCRAIRKLERSAKNQPRSDSQS